MKSEFKTITIDELPRYNHWPAKILGLESINTSLQKTPESIVREYGQDKWGEILSLLKNDVSLTMNEIDKKQYGSTEQNTVAYIDENFYLGSLNKIQEAYFEFIEKQLQDHISSVSQIIELGAGYGWPLLKLAKLTQYSHCQFIGAEYTDSGIECIDILAQREQINLQVGYCDLNQLSLNQFKIIDNPLIFTSGAMICLKGFSKTTLDELIRIRPRIVIHFEPIYEYCNDNSLHSLMCKRYIQLNDYNQNMLTTLKEYEKQGYIKIVQESRNIFGTNPLMPFSVVKWVVI